MNHRKQLLAFASASSLAFGLCASPAYAQDQTQDQTQAAPAADEAAAATTTADQAAPAPAANDDTGEIVVTAQKRAENVQDVPISIAAYSGSTLERNNVVNVEGLAKITPNLSVAKGAQTSYVRLAIRGIGAASNTTVEPSVAVFLDGAYVPRVGAVVSSMLDMESVEVLRGPQGTLFGRNASVGAVSFHTAQPKFGDLSGELTGEIGNGNRYRAYGYLNVPVGDHSAFRFAGSQQWFKGYWHNELDGKQVGGTDDTILRGSFRTEVGPFDWVFRADYAKVTGDAATNIDFDRSSVSDAQWNFFSAFLGAPDTNLNDDKMNQYLTANVKDKQWGLNSTLSFDVGGGSTVRLIDNYRDWKNTQLDGDVIFTPSQILSRTAPYDSKSQNHELQFISPTGQWLDGRLDLVAGLYYFHEKYEQGERLHMNSQFCKIIPPTPLPSPPFPPGTTQKSFCNGMLAANGGTIENATVQDVHQTTDSYAAYAQANFHFTDQFFATAGGRFSKDKKDGSYNQQTNPLLATVRALEVLDLPDIDDSRFTYRLGLNYEPTQDLLFFGTYSTGYKSAGYNSGAGSPSLTTVGNPPVLVTPQRRVFDRETTENWELGAKTSWLDRKLTLNLTFYRMNIKGFQDRAFDGTSFTVRNAGNLRHQGFEFDGVAKPVRNLSLFASVAYLDSEFTDYPNAPGLPGCAPTALGVPAACVAAGLGPIQDLKGKPATFAPKWSGRLGFDWYGDFGSSGWGWDLTSNLTFVSKQYGGLQNDANPQTIIDGYALLGARATLNGPGNRWSVALFGNNLLDKQYEAGNLYQFLGGSLGLGNGVYPGSMATRRLHADPRTYGISGTIRF
ncbi:TonB-dependent receptor [Sphingomonas sp. SM33]|uniref:TonB-dependent receptor n=1 Tax=Sphingomonas telluris TaxID=2907998 RepID=A0ABS9VPJ4_9SPHN|nr:TonB-dependent receptor [Sphingomonas telluris]